MGLIYGTEHSVDPVALIYGSNTAGQACQFPNLIVIKTGRFSHQFSIREIRKPHDDFGVGIADHRHVE